MEKKSSPESSPKTKPEPVRMIPHFTMASTLSQMSPLKTHEFQPLTQHMHHLSLADLAPLSTAISQHIPAPDLTSLSNVSQEDLDLLISCIQIACFPFGYATEPEERAGNIPMLDVLTDNEPSTPKRQTEHVTHRPREITAPREDEQSQMSEEEMDQTILDILQVENADSPSSHTPSSHTPEIIPVSQPSHLSQRQSSDQSPSLAFILEGQSQGQYSPPHDSTVTTNPSAVQQLLPVGQAYPASEFPCSFGYPMPSLGGHGPQQFSGAASYPAARGGDSEMVTFPVFGGYRQGPSPDLHPSSFVDYRQEAGSTSQEGQPRLWKFVLDLLEDPRYNPSLITWVSRPEGIFRLMDPPRLAEFWGHVKGNKSMNYEKLSRGLRYYYNHQVLEHVPGKLVYKFGPTAQVWSYLSQTSQPRPTTTQTSTVTSQYPPHTSH